MLNKIILLFSLLFSVSVSAGNKVTICHVPPGNPGNPQTLHVSENALRGHFDNNGKLHHGDYLGACLPTGRAGFYPCNIGIKHSNTFDGTSTSHDYVTYSYERIDGSSETDEILEAKRQTYDYAFERITAFERKLLSVDINLSSERYGTDYFVDFCFDGRGASNAKKFAIEDVSTFSSNPFPVRVNTQLFCDIYNRGNGSPELSQMSNNGSYPFRLQYSPEFCLLRVHVVETKAGQERNWSQNFNSMTAIIELSIDGQNVGSN
jgi:hypothetical protein